MVFITLFIINGGQTCGKGYFFCFGVVQVVALPGVSEQTAVGEICLFAQFWLYFF